MALDWNKMKFSCKVVVVLISYLIPSVLLSGCSLMYRKAPDLHQTRWKSMFVEYQIRDGASYIKKTWSTTDRRILDRLSQSLKVKHAGDIWGVGTMTSNKITLELTNGKRFILYVNEPTRLCMNEFPNPPTGFSLDVTHDFHDELKTIIESETKTTVYFYLPREYKGYLVIKRRKAK